MAYTPSQIITWAKICQFLSEVDIMQKYALDGGRKDRRHPRLLYIERKSLEYLYEQDPTSQYIFSVANYVLSLCEGFLAKAQFITGVIGGVIVDPVTQLGVSIEGFRIELPVAVGNPLQPFDTTYVVNIPKIVNGSINVVLPQDNIPQAETNQFSYTISYSENSATINFTNIDGSTNYGVQDGMLIIITGLKFIVV